MRYKIALHYIPEAYPETSVTSLANTGDNGSIFVGVALTFYLVPQSEQIDARFGRIDQVRTQNVERRWNRNAGDILR